MEQFGMQLLTDDVERKMVDQLAEIEEPWGV